MMQKVLTRLLLLVLAAALMCGMLTVSIAAAEQTTEQSKNPTNEELGGFFSPMRIEYAIKVTVQGMLMIFAVLAILWGVLAIFKVFLHDIPEKRAAKKQAMAAAVAKATEVQEPAAVVPVEDDGEIVAAITAAIAAMLESEEYADEFASGFRVVSFKRKGGAWDQNH